MNMDRANQLKDSWDIDMIDILKKHLKESDDEYENLSDAVYHEMIRRKSALGIEISELGEANSYDNDHRGWIQALSWVLQLMDPENR